MTAPRTARLLRVDLALRAAWYLTTALWAHLRGSRADAFSTGDLKPSDPKEAMHGQDNTRRRYARRLVPARDHFSARGRPQEGESWHSRPTTTACVDCHISRHSAQAYPMAGESSRLSGSYSRPLRALPNDPAKSQAREVHTVRTSVVSNKLEERLDRRDFMDQPISECQRNSLLNLDFLHRATLSD